MKSLIKLSLLTLLATAIAAVPVQSHAQSTNKPPAKKAATDTKETKKAAHPFRGKLAEVDKMAKTITVGKSVYLITSETKIAKNGKPATLADGVVGEQVTGYAKPSDDGKMIATRVTFGAKPEEKGEKKSAPADKAQKQP